MNIFMRVCQADKLFMDIGTAAVGNIKTDYGKNPDITGLWNNTMDTVQKQT